jgi:enoyl-CoA hydratase
MIDAQEAERIGLVSRLFPDDKVVEEAIAAAQKIASFSQPVVQMIKESVNHSSEAALASGIRFERRLFHSTFALEDRQEGMEAFAEKRVANFKHR